jgi:hypothetical protein
MAIAALPVVLTSPSPRGSHHALANLSDAPARFVLVCTPGRFERYFDLMTAEQDGVEPPPEARKPRPHGIPGGLPIGEYGLDMTACRADLHSALALEN